MIYFKKLPFFNLQVRHNFATQYFQFDKNGYLAIWLFGYLAIWLFGYLAI
jgi:hypothetical protein